jgi:hypothetical protein
MVVVANVGRQHFLPADAMTTVGMWYNKLKRLETNQWN